MILALILVSIALAAANNGPTVPVLPFTPQPIRITLADLPAPFNTPSASKPAINVAIPSNATLFVPDAKFRVSVYRDKLQAPRQMIYTPTGDILVGEQRGNRISILVGGETSIFADTFNGIRQVFGMAFTPVSLVFSHRYLIP